MPLIMLVRKPSLCKWWASLADLWAYWGDLHIYVCHPRKHPVFPGRLVIKPWAYGWFYIKSASEQRQRAHRRPPNYSPTNRKRHFVHGDPAVGQNALQPSIIYNLDVKMLASQQMGTVVYTNLSPLNVHQVQKRQQKRVAWFTFVELCLFLASGCWPASLRKAQLQKACITNHNNNPIPATPHQTTYTQALSQYHIPGRNAPAHPASTII